MPTIILGSLATTYVLKKGNISFKQLDTKYALQCLIIERATFASKFYINMYTNFVPFYLGVATGERTLGIFSVADKIRLIIQAIISPFLDLEFYRANKNTQPTLANLINSMRMVIWAAIVGCGSLALFAPDIIHIIAGKKYEESIRVLQLMSFSPVIILFSNIVGLQHLYKQGFVKEFNSALKIGALIGFILTPLLIRYQMEIGAGSAIIATEGVVLALALLSAKRIT
jgi:O-antigen/teichoic acid export membrane protein